VKSFLSKNPTIAFGLGLPLLLVIVFLLISGIPSLLVKSPQYDVLYTTGYVGYQNTHVQISVVEQKTRVTHQVDVNNRYQIPRLWRYNSETGAVKEIAIILPPNSIQTGNGSSDPIAAKTTTVIDIPDLERLTVDSSSIAPDGYEFQTLDDRHSRNFFGSMFYSPRYNSDSILTKKGRSIRLPNSGGRYYRDGTKLIGWVLAE